MANAVLKVARKKLFESCTKEKEQKNQVKQRTTTKFQVVNKNKMKSEKVEKRKMENQIEMTNRKTGKQIVKVFLKRQSFL